MQPDKIETERLVIDRFVLDDAPFILELVNEPDWIRYIGDKGVHDLAGAQAYLENGPIAMYAKLGYGLMRVDSKAHGVPVGMCGLLKRDTLPDADIGFALLDRWRNRGYAKEATQAVLQYGWNVLGFNRVLAITTPDNERSIKVLVGIGFRFEKLLKFSTDGPQVKLFGSERPLLAGSG